MERREPNTCFLTSPGPVILSLAPGSLPEALIGRKAATLAALILEPGANIAPGLVLTVLAFQAFLAAHPVLAARAAALDALSDAAELARAAVAVQRGIRRGAIPSAVLAPLLGVYCAFYRATGAVRVLVRASTTGPDAPGGKYSTMVQAHDTAALLCAVRKAWAALFDPAAVCARRERRPEEFAGVAVLIQIAALSPEAARAACARAGSP